MKIIYYSYLIGFILGIAVGCDTTVSINGETDDTPQIPAFEELNAESSYFSEERLTTSNIFSNGFNESLLSDFVLQFRPEEPYSEWIDEINSSEPDYEDGVWTWEILLEDAQNTIMIFTATIDEEADRVNWEVTLESDEQNRYDYITGHSTVDGDRGLWDFYVPGNNEHPASRFGWDYRSSSNFEVETAHYSIPANDLLYRSYYSREGSDNYVELEMGVLLSQFFGEDIILYWNEESGIGYLDIDGDQTCWDSALMETFC